MAKKTIEAIAISPPKFKVAEFVIAGTAPYVQARFAAKCIAAMKAKMEAGSTSKKGTKREARDFDEDFQQAQHISTEGWNGIPAGAFRNACIDVCRMVGFKMTHAKMALFFEGDGTDLVDGTALIRINAAAPERFEMATRNATGVADIRIRPMWREWSAVLRVRFDSDQFTLSDVTNLLMRAGQQVGVGEGRPFSKSSNGLGYGTFRIAGEVKVGA